MTRELPPTSRFAGDDGSADPDLSLALAEPDAGRRLPAVVHALARARLMVPVVAHVDEREAGGPATGQKSASAAMVTLAAPDGRATVPVFSSIGTLQRWRSDARPVPVEAVRAALSAVSDADGLLVLDPGGPVTVQVPRPAVWALAQQQPWVPAATDPEVAARVSELLDGVPGVISAEVEPGQRTEVRIVLMLRAGLSRAQVQQVTERAGGLLAGEELVAQRIDSLEFQVRSA